MSGQAGPYTDYMKDLTLKVRELVETAKLAKQTSLKDYTAAPEMSLTAGLESRLIVLFPQLEDKIAGLDDNLKQEPDNREIIILKTAERIIHDHNSLPSMKERANLAIHFAFASMTNATVHPAEIIPRVMITKEKYLSITFSNLLRMVKPDYLPVLVCVAELVRSSFSLANMFYSPELLKRLEEEVQIYDSDRWEAIGDFEFIKFLSFEIKGEPLLQTQVTRYRNVEGADGNYVRGGLVQFLLDFALKSIEILQLAKKAGLNDLFWINRQFLEFPRKVDEKKQTNLSLRPAKPVYSFDSAAFRLRYGRTATTGFFAVGMHPAAMYLLESLTPGCSLISDRFENKLAVFPVSDIAPPVVTLKDGSVIRIRSLEEAKTYQSSMTKILYLGDLLIDPADTKTEGIYFRAGYTPELWYADLKTALMKMTRNFRGSRNAMPQSLSADQDLEQILLGRGSVLPSPDLALRLTKELNIPYHPDWVIKTDNLIIRDYFRLLEWITNSDAGEKGIVGTKSSEIASLLQQLLVPFIVKDDTFLIPRDTSPASLLYELSRRDWKPWLESKSLEEPLTLSQLQDFTDLPFKDIQNVNLSLILGVIRKTTNRRMNPSVHALFPAGKSLNLVQDGEIKADRVKVELASRLCPTCRQDTFSSFCPVCKVKTFPVYRCRKGHGPFDEPRARCPECKGTVAALRDYEINLNEELSRVLNELKTLPRNLKTISSLNTVLKIPEGLVKGYIRALYGQNVFKDGTVRISAPLMPLTHWNVVPVQDEDVQILGIPSRAPNNVELFPLDVIINESMAKQFLETCNFINDLLEHYYGIERYFRVEKDTDLIGHFVGSISSDSLVSLPLRIVGITSYDLAFVHPFYFAYTGKKASDPADFFLLLDALLNFSFSLLPSKRGGTSGIPFFLEIPGKLDIVTPVELHQGPLPAVFFEQINELTNPSDSGWLAISDFEFEMLDNLVLGRDVPYFFDNPTGNSVFKSFPTENEFQKLSRRKKVEKQLELAIKLLAVDEKKVINFAMENMFDSIRKQFLKFLNQEFTCKQCHKNSLVPAITGKCFYCGGEIDFTMNPQTLERGYQWLEQIKDIFPLEEHHLMEIKKFKLDLKAILKRKQKLITEVFDE
ncbi:MAG: hypothetical protein ACFFD4_38280 [Candidatus Odinarchaeota archaeon]